MKAFRVVLDSQRQGDLGVETSSVASLSVVVTEGLKERKDDCLVQIGALTRPDAKGICSHYHWTCPDIGLGTRIEIEIVESENCVQPDHWRSEDEDEPSLSDEEAREVLRQDLASLNGRLGEPGFNALDRY